MAGLELVLLLLAASAALQLVARRLHLPHPVLLVVGGAVLAMIPGLPPLALSPDVIFLIFIPLLLYVSALGTSLRDFEAEFWPILRLAVLLVLMTVAAVAITAHWLTPDFTWPAAFALAAIVSPPDAIAATAAMRPLGAPSALVSILEGEGMLNDATALVVYRIAVLAAVTGTFSLGHAALRLLLTGAAGVVIGLAVAMVIVWARRYIRGLPAVENTVSLLTPFAAYLPADRVGASGILAVVAAGLYVSRQAPTLLTAATRLQTDATWSMVTFLLESLIFILIGLELPEVLGLLRQHALGTLLWYGVAVSLVVIIVRMLWVFPSAYVSAFLTRPWRKRSVRAPARPPWQWVVFVAWTGMRGGDSLVIALALPFVTARGTPFPARDLIVFVTFTVTFVTLVLQGLSVAPLLRVLGLNQGEHLGAEEAHARRVAAQAGLRRLDEVAARTSADPTAVEYLRRMQREQVREWVARDRALHGTKDAEHQALAVIDAASVNREMASYRTLRMQMLDAERRTIIQFRDRGMIGDDVLRRIQRDLDLETMLLGVAEEDTPEPPEGAP
ncbi:MAG TPA: Na+/H+ antiporter [Gemmatimonadaceae bacterium]|nr:Na+/H+ antiporter [Gemmatimonadaceae bacterium]